MAEAIVEERCRAIVRDVAEWAYPTPPLPPITREITLDEGLRFDDLDHVELLVKLETEFDIEVEDDQALHNKTFGDVVALVERCLAKEVDRSGT